MKKINVMVTAPSEIGTIVQKAVIEDYTDYYKLGNFELFDVVRVDWDGMEISLFIDDEGMLKTGNFGRDVHGYPNPLFGTIIITGGTASNGETLSVPEELNILDVPNFISEIHYVVR